MVTIEMVNRRRKHKRQGVKKAYVSACKNKIQLMMVMMTRRKNNDDDG